MHQTGLNWPKVLYKLGCTTGEGQGEEKWKAGIWVNQQIPWQRVRGQAG